MGEAEERFVGELQIPLDVLPAVGGVPPVAGKREGAAGSNDAPGMRAVEEGERVMVWAAGFGGDMDGDGRAIAAEGK